MVLEISTVCRFSLITVHKFLHKCQPKEDRGSKKVKVLSTYVHVVLVSLLTDQLSGQFLIFLVGQNKNCPVSESRQFSFVHSLVFLSSLDIREWPIYKKDWTIFLGPTKKMRNWLDNWLAKETDQNHMDVPVVKECPLMKGKTIEQKPIFFSS